MKVPIKFTHLHNPLFLAGKNHKDKLYSTEVNMIFDTEARMLFVLYKGEVAFIPEANTSSMTPIESEKFVAMFKDSKLTKPEKTHVSHAQKLDIKGAQVSDPSTEVQNPRKQ